MMPYIPTLNDYLSVAMPFIAIAFGIHVLYAALYYMWGNFMNNPQAYARGKEEVLSLLRTIGIFISVIVLYNLIILGFGIDFIGLAKLSVKGFFWMLLDRYMEIMTFDFILGSISHTGIFVFVQTEYASIEIGGSPIVGLSNTLTVLHKTLEPLQYGLSLAAGRYALLDFAPAGMIYLMPLGFFLRAFPLTRKTGSSIVALAITVFFVYPLSVLFTDYLVTNYEAQRMYPSTLPKNPFITGQTDEQVFSDFIAYMERNASKTQNEYIPPGKTTSATGEEGVWGMIKKWFSYIWNYINIFPQLLLNILKLLGSTIKMILTPGQPIFSPVGWVIPTLLVSLKWVSMIAEQIAIIFTIFILEITISITMYRNIAMLIGGELRIFGITKVTGG
ncbi:MAG: hypothetical protein ACPL06_00800 [Candidatus Anstonellales archaeon]